jgi:hypothetical protein
MQAPPPSPSSSATGTSGGGVGTTGPTAAATTTEPEAQEEERELVDARKEGKAEAEVLLDLLAPDEADLALATRARGAEAAARSVCAWTLGAVVLAAYWRTLPPGLAAGDRTGDFVAAACSAHQHHQKQQQQHPVLGLLLTELAVRLLIPSSCGSPAWRANMVSAVCLAVTTAWLSLSVHLLVRANLRRLTFLRRGIVLEEDTGGGRLRTLAAAGGVALVFAWSPRVWAHATKADAEPINVALLAAALYAALQVASSWGAHARRVWARAGVCVAGLALCNSNNNYNNNNQLQQPPTALLLHAPLLLFALVGGVAQDAPLHHMLLDLGAVFALSLLPCAYPPLASMLASVQQQQQQQQPASSSWGWEAGGGGEWAFEGVASRLASFAWDLAVQDGLCGLVPVLALVGVAACLGRDIGRFLLPARYTGDAAKVVAARDRHIQTALDQLPDARGQRSRQRQRGQVDQREREARRSSARVVWAVLGASMLSLLQAADEAPAADGMTVGAHLLCCFWAGVGLDWVLQQFAGASTQAGATRRALGYLGACALWLGLPLLQVLAAKRRGTPGAMAACPSGGVDIWRGYSSSLLEPLPHAAVLFVPSQTQWAPLRYHQVCEGLRPDVKVLRGPWRAVVDAWMDRAPGGVFLAGCVPGPDYDDNETYATTPFGLTMRMARRDAPWLEQQRQRQQQQWHERNRGAWHVVLNRVGW